jgi:hypothetical protein
LEKQEESYTKRWQYTDFLISTPSWLNFIQSSLVVTMQHAIKSVLVPPELFWRLDKRNLSDLDKSMHEILFDTQMSDEDKWKLYSQSLQKYLHQAGEQMKPLNIPLHGWNAHDIEDPPLQHIAPQQQNLAPPQQINAPAPPSPVFNVPLEALNTNLDAIKVVTAARISKAIKNKACSLLKILSEGKQVVWNNLGEVTINGVPVPRSNIVNLVTNIVKSKNDSRPHGWDKFAIAVMAANVPRLFVGENLRRQYIEAINTPPPSVPPPMLESPVEQHRGLRPRLKSIVKPYTHWKDYKL